MSRSIKVDLISAFAASGAKALAYAAISTLLLAGGKATDDFAMFTLIRSTLGLLNYATLGLGPAFIRQLAAALAVQPQGQSQAQSHRSLAKELYASAQYPSLMIGGIALLLLLAYTALFTHIHVVPTSLLRYAPLSALLVGWAMLARLLSDIPGGYLQASHRITLDNILLMAADLAWPPLTYFLFRVTPTPLLSASLAFAICYTLLSISRFAAAGLTGAAIFAPPSAMNRTIAWHLLAFGAMLTLSQLSDFLYAPTDFILINRFLTPAHLADYSVVVQLDAGMLLLTSAISTVLYPRASRALATRDLPTLKRYYVRGTLLTLALLITAAIILVIIRRPLLLMWLRTDRPGTATILPLLLVHTVIGGSIAAGRAILLAAGKARVFALSAVIAGVVNVIVSYTLVRYTDLALVGVILGTLSAVVIRCGVFIPWYTLRILKELPPPPAQEVSPEATDYSVPE